MHASVDELRRMLDLAMAFAQATKSVEQHITDEGYRHDDGSRLAPSTRTKREVWMALKSVSHFNLHQALELILKFILRLEETKYDNRHPLVSLHDQLSSESREELQRAYEEHLLSKTPGERLHGIAFYYGNNPPAPPPLRMVDTLRQGFEDLDEDLRLYTRRYAYENVGRGEITVYIFDLDPWINFFDDASKYAHRLFRAKAERGSPEAL